MQNKFFSLVGITIAIVAIMSGCEKGPNFREFSYPQQQASGISPGIGFPGQNVTITGSNFDTLKGAVKVWFGGIQATTIVSATGNQIVVQVPTNAVSGKVSLQVWTTKTDSIGVFTVLPAPAISSVQSHGIASNIAAPGDTVFVSGLNFLTDPTKVAVDFNGTPATNIVSITSTLIKVITPSGYTAGYVNLTFNGNYKITGGTSLAPGITPGDVSIIFLKNYMPPFKTTLMLSDQKFTGSNWGTPDYWTVSSAAQNQLNSGATLRSGGLNFGKTGKANIGELCLQAGWGDAIGNVLTNGKMYQTVTLPAGSYQVNTQIVESGFSGYPNSSNMYLVVANGTTLPDLVSPGTAPTPALASVGIQNSVAYNSTSGPVKSLTFTLAAPAQVSIGFVATMVANSYVRLNYLKLILQ